MANLASTLKEEISRIASREIRQQTAGTAKAVTRLEREIAALNRRLDALQDKPSSPPKEGAPKQTAGKKKTGKTAATKKQTTKAAPASDKQSLRSSFSAAALKAHRERLGLSADNYGRLIGVSGLSIYNWEQEKARPREGSIEALMTIKRIGKREAAKRLEALGESQPKAKAKAKKKANGSAKNGNGADQGADQSES